MPGNRCSNCIAYSFDCTYVEAAKVCSSYVPVFLKTHNSFRNEDRLKGNYSIHQQDAINTPCSYVESLENRVEKLEKLLKRVSSSTSATVIFSNPLQLCPDEALYKKLTESLDNNWMTERTPLDPSSLVGSCSTSEQRTLENMGSQSRQGTTLGLHSVTSAIRGVADESTLPTGMTDDEEDTALILADNLKRMEIEPKEYRFFGKSSGAMLVRTALELKNEYTGSEITTPDLSKPPLKNLRGEFWTQQPVSVSECPLSFGPHSQYDTKWERNYNASPPPQYHFPEPDLSKHLVDLYFQHVNIHLPLLNRCIFEKWIEDGLHLTNKAFAPVYLLVCALGARYSNDPRAMLDGHNSTHSRGWKWFDQVHMVKRSPLSAPTLFDLQVYCVRHHLGYIQKLAVSDMV
jgi:hypothetical protein